CESSTSRSSVDRPGLNVVVQGSTSATSSSPRVIARSSFACLPDDPRKMRGLVIRDSQSVERLWASVLDPTPWSRRSGCPQHRPPRAAATPPSYPSSCVSLRSPLPSAFTMCTSRLRRKAIVRPSGDHANQRTFAAPCVSRRSPLPSAFTTKRSEFPADPNRRPSNILKAIRRPSGDHAGSPEVALGASRRASLPSAFITQSPCLVGSRTSAGLWAKGTKAIRCPSGDHAPASGTFLGSFLRPLPSAFTRYRPYRTAFPSADQLGLNRWAGCVVSRRSPLPSAFTTERYVT